MTDHEFILSCIIEREGNCMGIPCDDCPLDTQCTSNSGTYIAAKNMLGVLNPSLLFDLLL